MAQPEDRGAILAVRRIIELRAHPIQGDFDVAHLKETHRYIFQDFPKAGLWAYNVQPGEYRIATQTWCKERTLESIKDRDGKPDFSYTTYSRMDDKAIAKLDETLKGADPEKLKGMKKDEFIDRFGKLYSDLDYIHPFREGNSRTLRTFTDQLAKEAGYELHWEKFSGDRNRDLLYIARDRALAERAGDDPDQHPVTLAKALHDSNRHQEYPSLTQLLEGTIEQARAPRRDLDKSQAWMHATAAAMIQENIEALKKNPALANRSQESLEKLAYFRGILREDMKRETPEAQQAALARFDLAAGNPAFPERLERNAPAKESDDLAARRERKDSPEIGLC
ncbi:MAG: Fic family protein [Candidatus Accumulibacter sp.]|jgi:cell filamentation protein|nr:Fic family protein [Accumulibacter sp.]